MLALTAGILLLLCGFTMVVVVLIRKLPALAEFETPPSTRPRFSLQKTIARLNIPLLQQRLFAWFEVSLRVTRSMLFSVLRASEKLLHNAQKMAGEKETKLLPSFLSRVKKRKAYLEEERKLIEWLTQNPQDVAAYKRLGNLYSVAGNINDARAAFQQALKLNPEDDEIKKRLDELASK